MTTTKKRIKIEPKKLIYKKIITNSQDSMYFKIIKNKRSKSIDRKENTPNKIYKRNNLSLNITNETKFYKTNEFIKIKISSSNIKKNINVSRNIYNNICRSQRQRHCLKNDFSNINLKKIIFVNKKKENNNINEKNHVKHNNTLNLSYKDLSSININNPMNKIFVNKKENLSKTIKKKINKKNNASKLDIEKINNLEVKNSLNDYKKLLETEYNTFIPRTIIKKMFFNKLNCESKSNNEHKKYSPIKKRDISIKNNQNASSWAFMASSIRTRPPTSRPYRYSRTSLMETIAAVGKPYLSETSSMAAFTFSALRLASTNNDADIGPSLFILKLLA